MNFNEFLAHAKKAYAKKAYAKKTHAKKTHAKKAHGVPLDTLAKEVGAPATASSLATTTNN